MDTLLVIGDARSVVLSGAAVNYEMAYGESTQSCRSGAVSLAVRRVFGAGVLARSGWEP
jgi:hypothetical protein